MTRRTTQIVPARPRKRGLFRPKPESLELVGVSFRPMDHFTRLWPTSDELGGPGTPFRLLVLPVRLAALTALWVTATPVRATLTAVLLTASALWHFS